MTLPPALLPEGLRDRLPPQAEAASRLMHRVIVAIGRHGYARVQPPLAEFEEGLVGRLKAARAQDLLRVVDPLSQRMLALRPDMTAQVGRIATTRMARAPRPLRLAYGGQVVKLRATQLRPEREMAQAGAELIGSDTVAATIEILNVAIDALQAAGIEGITIDLTLPDLVDTLAAGPLPLAAAAREEQVRALLDAKDAAGLAAAGAGDYLPLLSACGPVGDALGRLRALDLDHALDSRLAAIDAIVTAIGPRATLTLDPTERHGFEYQSWIGFAFFARGLAGEIGRGGSYTLMHGDGAEEQAVGFSLFLDPLVDVGLGQEPVRRIFLPPGHDPAAAAALRAAGWTTVAALEAADAPVDCTHILGEEGPAPI